MAKHPQGTEIKAITYSNMQVCLIQLNPNLLIKLIPLVFVCNAHSDSRDGNKSGCICDCGHMRRESHAIFEFVFVH